jgi:hypothetical protein
MTDVDAANVGGASAGQEPAKGAVTIVTQTRVRPESADAFARWQEETSAIVATFSRVHQADGDAAEPSGPSRLGHSPALRQHRGKRGLAQLRAAT